MGLCKSNNWYVIDNYMVGISANTNEEIYISSNQIDKVDKYIWRVVTDKRSGYKRVVTSIHLNNGKCKIISIWTLITGLDYVDHKNGNTLDNRDENIRMSTHGTNMQNKKMYKNNTSGFTGVKWDKREGQWCAYIRYNNICYHLGYFNDFNDAILARLKAEAKYFNPEFAPHREIFDEYHIDIEYEKEQPDKLLCNNNTSGITGVGFVQRDSKWYACIRHNKHNYWLGQFDNKDDAVRARLKKEIEIFGYDKSPQRHLFKQYGITMQNDLKDDI